MFDVWLLFVIVLLGITPVVTCFAFRCRPFLLECGNKEIRTAFSEMLQKAIKAFFHHGGMPVSGHGV